MAEPALSKDIQPLIDWFSPDQFARRWMRMRESGLHILVVDDEHAIRRFLRASLTTRGHTVWEAENGLEAVAVAAEHRPDMIFLDLELPDIDGIDVTRQLREWTQTPIIVFSVQNTEKNKVDALDAGADDYLTKPFGIGELMARMRGVLRRSFQTVPGGPIFTSAGLQVDLARRRVLKDAVEVGLTPTEYDLLKLLVHNAGKVITHQQVIATLWGAGYADAAHLLRVNISNLRRKIESDPTRPQHILTEPGVGYRLKVDE
jgi:two-component system KDP operon response regulator KdpE